MTHKLRESEAFAGADSCGCPDTQIAPALAPRSGKTAFWIASRAGIEESRLQHPPAA